MLEITKNLRPNSLIPPYPNYHNGPYFEEYFFTRFISEYPDNQLNGFTYIPIFWTNCYTNKIFVGNHYEIQKILDKLPSNIKYFTVSQHDDCVYENLPRDTIIFSMGGNKIGDRIIPIPLICSPIPKSDKNKTITISFVGSLTHKIRDKLYSIYQNDKEFLFKIKSWELFTDNKNINTFIDIMASSNFTLAPRGYGKTSFRMYEAMQLDSIPIYVYDIEWLPWKNEIDWDKLIIRIQEDEIEKIKEKIDKANTSEMLAYKNEVYDNYFTYNGVYNNIIKNIEDCNIKFNKSWFSRRL